MKPGKTPVTPKTRWFASAALVSALTMQAACVENAGPTGPEACVPSENVRLCINYIGPSGDGNYTIATKIDIRDASGGPLFSNSSSARRYTPDYECFNLPPALTRAAIRDKGLKIEKLEGSLINCGGHCPPGPIAYASNFRFSQKPSGAVTVNVDLNFKNSSKTDMQTDLALATTKFLLSYTGQCDNGAAFNKSVSQRLLKPIGSESNALLPVQGGGLSSSSKAL